MLFKYQGFNHEGKKVKGIIEAESLDNAKNKLKYEQIIYTKLFEDNSQWKQRTSFLKRRKISSFLLATISRDISIYLKSGISLLNAIKLIKERYKNDKKLYSFLSSLVTSLDEGNNFFTALTKQKIIILPEFYLQSIKISENEGLLENVLNELSIYLKTQDRINKQIKSAMAYPLFIIIVSFLMVGFMLNFIVPKVTAIFIQNNQELPFITKLIIDLGAFINTNHYLIVIGLFFIISVTTYILNSSSKVRFIFDRFLLQIPFLNKAIELNELSRFSYLNAILLKAGVPIVQSFKMGSNILKNRVFMEVFTSASKKVVEGGKLSKILEQDKTYQIDKSFIQAIAIGEETSELSKMLEELSKLYNSRNKDIIDMFLKLIEPILMLIVGTLIGFIVIAMLLPIFSMSSI